MTALALARAADEDRMGFVLALRQSGATDTRVLSALERLDRAAFAAPAFRALAAYGDLALPLADHQSMTRPSVVARVLAGASIGPRHRVLEIGSGSGYQTAALATLAGEVVSVERVGVLAAEARSRAQGACVLHEDGLAWLGDGEKFDRIVVNAALPQPPFSLFALVASGGALIAPMEADDGQRLFRWRFAGAIGFIIEDLGPSRFAPIGRGLA